MINIQHLDIKFNDKLIVSDISLTFKKGQKYILLGRNGSGKSSLMKSIFEASIIKSDNIDVLNNKIFYSDNISIEKFSKHTGFDYLDAYFQDYYGDDWFKNEKINLKLFNIENKMLSKRVSQLSGGERRVLNMIVSIYGDYDILFIDELESNLDSSRLKISISELNRIWKDKIVIIATHNQEVINSIIYNKVLMIKKQKLVDITRKIKNNSLKDIFKNEKGVIDENFKF